MRLAFTIFRYFPFGGLQRDMLAIAQEAVARGHEVTIFCGEWLGEKPKKIAVVIIDSSTFFQRNNVRAFVENFNASFQRNSVDLVVGFNKMPGLDVYFAGDSCFAQKAYAERNIFYRMTARARTYLDYEHAVFGTTSRTAVLSIAKREQANFAHYYSTAPERFHELPPGIARSQYHCENAVAARISRRAEWRADAATKIILCVGSGFKTKGLERSIAAFAQLRTRVANALLVVVGADNPKKYLKQAEQLGISHNVIFLGGRTDVAEIFHAADVLLHPAHRELAGNVIIEAMLAGTPVIATDVCGFAHYIAENNMGVVLAARHQQQKCVDALHYVLDVKPDVWKKAAQQFADTVDVFSRQVKAVTVLEQLADAHHQPNQEIVLDTSEHTVILRDEFVSHWAGKNIFVLVETLAGPIARELADRQTLRFEVDGKGYYRKLHRGVGWKEIIKNLLQLRLPVLGAKNEWLALNKLHALGIPSLEPLAYGEQKGHPARRKSFIVTRELVDAVQLDHYFKSQTLSCKAKTVLLREVATLAREMHRGGINHRDFYLCHFMLTAASIRTWQQGITPPQLHIVDLHRAQIRQQVPLRWLVKDLSGLYFSSLDLGFTRNDYLRFMREYWQLPLRNIFSQHAPLLHSISTRAVKTYQRDTGRLPVLPIKILHS